MIHTTTHVGVQCIDPKLINRDEFGVWHVELARITSAAGCHSVTTRSTAAELDRLAGVLAELAQQAAERETALENQQAAQVEAADAVIARALMSAAHGFRGASIETDPTPAHGTLRPSFVAVPVA